MTTERNPLPYNTHETYRGTTSTTPDPPGVGKWVLTGGGFLEVINGVYTIQGNQEWAYVGATSASIGSISPASGPTTGGTLVTINGAGFNGTNTVKFGSTPVKFQFVNDRTVIATTKPGTGTVDVTVITTNDGTTSVTPADQFTFVASDIPAPVPVILGMTLNGTL